MKGSGISGLAVLEGILIKNNSKYALAVRKPDEDIEVLTGRCSSIADKNTVFTLPFMRGIISFAETVYLGIKNFAVSEKFYEEEVSEDNEGLTQILIIFAVITFAIGLFLALPYGISLSFEKLAFSEISLTLIEGLLRIVLLVIFIIGISMLPDIKRLYMYLGAEHKALNCVNKGLPLTVTNVRKMSRTNIRCAATFLSTVIMLSVILFMFVRVDNIIFRVLIRLFTVPFVAALTYEIMELADKSNLTIFKILNSPAMFIQSIITAEPEDEMIEVAIESVSVVIESKKVVIDDATGVKDELYKPSRTSRPGIKRVSKDKAKRIPNKDELQDNKKTIAPKKTEVSSQVKTKSEKKHRADNAIAERAKQSLNIKEGIKTVKISENEDDEILNALNHFFNSKKEEEKKRGKRRSGQSRK